jgi:hypothetical protein
MEVRFDMSYCVNCGVELDASAKSCPLCNTPVVNPRELEKMADAKPVFPEKRGEVETVKRKDLGILVSVVAGATAVTCGILNVLVFQERPWSLAVIGACVILWVALMPAVINTKQPVYATLFLDGCAVVLYLYMLTFLVGDAHWFWGLGMPVTLLTVILAEAFTFCIRRFKRSFLAVGIYMITALGILCAGLELLIDRYLREEINLGWSAIVLTVCVILDIALVTVLSRRRLRDAVRRRLHF